MSGQHLFRTAYSLLSRLDDQAHQGYRMIMAAPNVKMSEDEPAVEAVRSTSTEDLSGLSLYAKKSILINREIDRMGMGRYQWYLFFLAVNCATVP